MHAGNTTLLFSIQLFYQNMKSTLLSLILAIVGVGCTTSEQGLAPLSSVPPGVAKEGSLANPALAQDASLAIRKIMGANKRVIKFVIQQPVGSTGRKAWREMWVFDPERKAIQFILTFRENGQGSADFQIQRM